MAIQSYRLAITTRVLSDAHPKTIRKLHISTTSSPSDPAAPDNFDATYIMSYSIESGGTVLGVSSFSLKATHMGFSRGHTHVGVILLDDLHDRSLGLGADIIWEETPTSLLVS